MSVQTIVVLPVSVVVVEEDEDDFMIVAASVTVGSGPPERPEVGWSWRLNGQQEEILSHSMI